MIKINGFNRPDTNIFTVPAGAYVCKIVAARTSKSKSGKPMLVISADVCEGRYANFYRTKLDDLRLRDPKAAWPFDAEYRVRIFDSYGYLHSLAKRLLRAVCDSNDGFNVDDGDFDEASLVGKVVGFVFAGFESKATKKDGSHYVNTRPHEPITAEDVRTGNYEIPPVQPYEPATTETTPTRAKTYFEGEPVAAADLPF